MNEKIEILKRRMTWLNKVIAEKRLMGTDDHWLTRERNALQWVLDYVQQLEEKTKDLEVRLERAGS